MPGQAELDAVVIVTGAARGLGRAMVLGLAGAGARVAAMDLAASRREMLALVESASARGLADRILPVFGDVTQYQDCVAAVEATVNGFGSGHGLVNNAAIGMQDIGFGSTARKFFEVDVDAWRAAFAVNVHGAFNMAKAVTPRLVAQNWGRVVNITTSLPTMVMENFSPYGPTKAALEAATAIWAKEVAETGVTVNALLPGAPADTRMIPAREVPDRTTLVHPEAMVPPIIWLMSRDSDGVTGQRIIAKEWDTSAATDEAARRATSPVGWRGSITE